MTSINVEVQGAEGADGERAGNGGRGARVQAVLAVVPDETLRIYVGGRGGSDCGGTVPAAFNGGGPGACNKGGGGASDIRQGGASLSNRIVIAGGGGGGAGARYPGGAGGGGGLEGSSGQMGAYDGGAGGGGGTSTAGGAAGAGMPGTAGVLGNGGQGGPGLYGSGGAGGGGYYGGGGGGGSDGFFGEGGGGGGGGSSYVSPGNSTTSIDGSYRSGHGQVVLRRALESNLGANESYGGDNGCAQHNTPEPVTTSTGNFWHAFGDLSIPGRGPALNLSRTYNSLAAGTDSPFGWGWANTYGMSLAIDPSTGAATITQEKGSQVVFSSSGGIFRAPSRALATLVHNADGTYTYNRRVEEIFTFDSNGKLSSIKDLNDYHTDLTYSAGRLSTVTDSQARTLTFAWVGSHVSSVTDTASPVRSVQYGYDGAGNLTDVIDVNGGHGTFTYDGFHRLVTMRAPKYYADVTTTPTPELRNHYDAAGRVDSQTSADGQTTTFDYTSVPDSTKVTGPTSTDPNGNVTLDTYASGVLVSQTHGYGTPKAATSTREYDAATLRCTKVIDANGHSSSATYDAAGNRTRTTDPLGHEARFTYNALNQLTSATDPKGVVTSLTYDTAPGAPTPGYNLKTTSTPLLDGSGTVIATQTTTLNYLELGNTHAGEVTSVVDPDGKTWSFGHDTNGMTTSVTDPLNHKSTSTFDSVGRQTSQVSARGNLAGAVPAQFTTTFAFDPDGKVTQVTDPLGHGPQSHYDANRNLDYTRDANTPPNQTNYQYDAANRITEATRADSPATTLRKDYWPDGTLHHQYDGANQATAYDYDSVGRVASVTDPLGRVTTYGYDLAGNVVTKADHGGSCPAWPIGYPPTLAASAACTVTGYDNANQPTSISYSDPGTPNVTNIVYDADGQRTAMTDTTGTSTWGWDSLHRLTSQLTGATVAGGGRTLSYGYDLRNHVTSITYPGPLSVIRGFDNAGNLTSVKDWLNNQSNFSYDADNNLTTRAFPSPGVTDILGYDKADRLGSITMTTSSTTVASFNYGRTTADQLSSVASTGVSTDNHTYDYTKLNQLKGVDGASHTYDAADNLTALPDGRAQAHDVANQLTSSTAGTPAAATWGGPGDTPVQADYDGDHKADRAVFGQSSGLWAIHGSAGIDSLVTFGGLPGDKAVPADYTGDDKADIAIYRSGVWLLHPSDGGPDTTTVFGLPTDVAVPADYDGDGKADLATFRAATGAWSIRPSGGGPDISITNGAQDDVPVAADYDGDHKADVAVFRPSNRVWYIHRSSDGVDTTAFLGSSGATPVPGDYDGDGKANLATYQPATGVWVRRSVGGDSSTTFGGVAGDLPVPADYDGDGKADLGIFRPGASATWSVNSSTTASFGYDTRGNRTSSTPPSGPSTTYAYDQANRLKATAGTTYAYDGDGLRKAKTVAGATTAFTWQQLPGQLPLLLSEGTASSTTKYIYGPGGQIIEQVSPANTATFLHTDQLGSMRVATQGTSVVGTFTFDAYGRLSRATGPTRTPFGYAGQYTDAETGFVYLRARYYDPGTGQFISRDPLVALTGSAYGYTGGNPLNGTDPLGLFNFGKAFKWARVALDAGSATFALGALITDAVGLPEVGAVLGQVSTGLSVLSAADQCLLIRDSAKSCTAAVAVAALSAATFGLSKASKLAGGRVLARGVQFGADLISLGVDAFSSTFDNPDAVATMGGAYCPIDRNPV